MKRRGVCYDVGRVMMEQDWRPAFDSAEVCRELQIIRDDLHCNAIRICGQPIDRLRIAGEHALDLGLEVWLSPELWDHPPDETLDYIVGAAKMAEKLRRRDTGRVVLSVGSELTLFMKGIVEGNTFLERYRNPSFLDVLRSGAHNRPLNAFLAEASRAAREAFGGTLTYASVPLEEVDWSPFDFVCTDLYRDKRVRDKFPALLQRFLAYGRPVAITEFGCCTYRGAADAGGWGWAIVETDERNRPRLKGDYVRDETEQARELTDVLSIFDEQGVDGAFVMTFVAPLLPHSDDPKCDLDMASYSLVKSYGSRLGSVYPGMPWDPKEAFHAVAGFYACAGPRMRPPH